MRLHCSRSAHRHAALLAALCLLASLAGCQQGNGAAQAQPLAAEASGNSPGASAAGNAAMGEDGSRAAGGNQDASAENFAGGGGGDDALQSVTLPDPSLGGMPATVVQVPAGWQVQGQIVINQCGAPSPWAAWSAKSPDGQEVLDVLPPYRWLWGSNAQYGQGCDSLSGTPSAADFLTSFAAQLPGHVQIVGAMPVSDAFRSREEAFTQRVRSGAGPDTEVAGDVGGLRIIDGKGYAMQLRAWVQCERNAQGGDCFAKVDIVRAPRGKLEALVALVDGHDLLQDQPTPQWMAAYTASQNHGGSP